MICSSENTADRTVLGESFWGGSKFFNGWWSKAVWSKKQTNKQTKTKENKNKTTAKRLEKDTGFKAYLIPLIFLFNFCKQKGDIVLPTLVQLGMRSIGPIALCPWNREMLYPNKFRHLLIKIVVHSAISIIFQWFL